MVRQGIFLSNKKHRVKIYIQKLLGRIWTLGTESTQVIITIKQEYKLRINVLVYLLNFAEETTTTITTTYFGRARVPPTLPSYLFIPNQRMGWLPQSLG